MPIVTESEPALTASAVAIPEGLCGVEGCVFLDGHEQRGQSTHTWQS